jgi:hypothetical protein
VTKLDFKKALTTALTSIVFVALGMGTAPSKSGTGSTGESNKPKAAAQDPPKENKSPDVTVAAATLLKAYQDNQVAADANYKGKRLRVSGKLHNVTTGFIGGVDLNVNGGGQFEITNVTCKFKEAPPGAARLSPGDSVTVDGDCSGGMTIGLVLDNCRLVSP